MGKIKWGEFGSDGLSLNFHEGDNDIRLQYLDEVNDAEMRAYERLRCRHGIWSSARDTYVPIGTTLGGCDSLEMEYRYASWRRQGKSKAKQTTLFLYGKRCRDLRWAFVTSGTEEQIEQAKQDNNKEYLSYQVSKTDLSIHLNI